MTEYLSIRRAGAILTEVAYMEAKWGVACRCAKGHYSCAVRDGGTCSDDAREIHDRLVRKIADEHEQRASMERERQAIHDAIIAPLMRGAA